MMGEGRSNGQAQPARGRRVLVALAVGAALALLAAANAHLVWVASVSDPGCVDHARVGEGRPGAFGAPGSAC